MQKSQKSHIDNLITLLKEHGENNNSNFWQVLDKFRKINNKDDKNDSNITMGDWVQHLY